MPTDLDYLTHIAEDSALFASALRSAPTDAQVPSCPDWNAADLLWHLTEVQWFWSAVVGEQVQDPEELRSPRPQRPDDIDALRTLGEQCSRELLRALRDASPETRVWTWSQEHSVAFILRRQAHEALIHRLDAELVSGSRSPMDTRLSADGVDEALRVMYGGTRPGEHTSPDERSTVRITASDTGQTWLVTVGRSIGTSPDGKTYDEPTLLVAETDTGADVRASIKGAAVDLDCWLWHRPTSGPVDRSGDAAVLSAFDAVIADGID